MNKQQLSDLRSTLVWIERIDDPAHLMEVWSQAKGAITGLVEANRLGDAENLIATYNRSFGYYKHQHEATTQKIIHAFPVNNEHTLRLLGISDEIDRYIVKHKVDVGTLSHDEKFGYPKCLGWAIRQQDTALIEVLILQVSSSVKGAHPGDSKQRQTVCHTILEKLLSETQAVFTYSSNIDKAVADLVSLVPNRRYPAALLIDLAERGMRQTAMALMSNGMIRRYDPAQFSEEQTRLVTSILPADPSPAQLHWIVEAIDLPGLPEKILFDPAVNLDEFINAMGSTDFGIGKIESNLTMESLGLFKHLLMPEHLNSVERRKRAKKLVSAVCDEECAFFNMSPEALEEELLRNEFSEYVFRFCNQLKVKALEDELGM
jgi:hypothetical protein